MLCFLGGCKGSEPTAYEVGTEHLEKEKYTQAIENFQNAIQEGDHTVQSWRGIGEPERTGAFDVQVAFYNSFGTDRTFRKGVENRFVFLPGRRPVSSGKNMKNVQKPAVSF